MAQKKKQGAVDIRSYIRETAKETASETAKAMYIAANRTTTDAYKATERRLYAYPVLLNKIAEAKARLQVLGVSGPPAHSKSIVRFMRSGVRLTPEEILEALEQDLTATIAADEYEVETIAGALRTIEGDAYYQTVAGRFIDGLTDDAIADSIPCDPSTVRRNRGRLIRKLAVWLYGAQAV